MSEQKNKPVRPAPANKREKILTSALKVFCYYGFDAATLGHIAAEAGVSKPLIIKYYGNKRNLVIQCIDRFMVDFFQKANKSASQKGITYEQHTENVFQLIKVGRSEFKFVFTIWCTPAHDDITRDLLPIQLRFAEGVVAHFTSRFDPKLLLELTYSMIALYFAYVIEGSEDTYRKCKKQLFEHYVFPAE